MRTEPGADGREPVALMEMTLRNLMALDERVDHADFLAGWTPCASWAGR